MRYVATIEMYVHGETPHEAMKEALVISKGLNDKLDCHADVSQIHKQPFATLGSTELDAHALKMEIMNEEE